MMDSYVEKFHILETFRSNHEQNILIGSMKDNPNDIVVINILRDKEYIWSNAKEKIEGAFENLLHVEKIDNGLVIVTGFKEGISLDTYLEKRNPNSIEKKLNLLGMYLNSILRYDSLDNWLKSMLIDESQIVVEDGKMYFNEWITIDENATGDPDFSKIAEKVGKIARKIFFYDITNENKKEYLPHQIIHFIEKLENQSYLYKNLSDICHAFQNLYIYNWYMNDNKNIIISNSLSPNSRKSRKERKYKGYAKVIAGVLLVAAISYAYLHFPQQDKITADENREPTAYFEKIQMKNQWEFINKSIAEGKENDIVQSLWEVYRNNKIIGTYDTRDLTIDFSEPQKYKIVLKVQDKNHQWSKPYFEEVGIVEPRKESSKNEIGLRVDSREKFEGLTIDYDENQVVKDKTKFRSGTYAIKFVESSDSKNIKIKGLQLDQSAFLSMWLMSDHKDPVSIQITGYHDSQRSFQRTMHYQPSAPNVWELMSLQETIAPIDEMEIVLSNAHSTVWMDDIELDIYK